MNEPIDHYVWEGYYIRDRYSNESGSIYATTRDEAMRLVAEDAGVPNEGWEMNERADYPLYQLHDTRHHVVTVVQRPVYGEKEGDQ